ncbi:hypothetical protein BjapCC829_23760 [Bradyrhizobium barranii]|uniref:HEPN AbiU2-like domain-containing protein n=1 Tax=Bradyrhizobium barranii TaxID=2992140 RepID=A0ABY3QAU3_9BRAD|nr:hypothetical protein [Bradyrhizobium japonicum]UFW83005.1 hypothetical protein BjapCC829_23760 [Bradyrhizobium japonicum]
MRKSSEMEATNLEKGRPFGWQDSELFCFIEECWNNSLAVVGNKGIACQRLTEIDRLFESMQSQVKPTSMDELVPSLLFLRSFVAYRASIMVLLSLPTDGFPLLRSSLEYAGYSLLMKDEKQLAEAWLRRDETDSAKKLVRDTFTQKRIRAAIAAKDKSLADNYQLLYERTIDWGAHPNEKALTPSLVRESFRGNTKQIQFKMLGESGVSLDHALRTAAQVGICVLKIFVQTIAGFRSDGISLRLKELSVGL